MLNLCWFKHKKIFECFRCFWKVFRFYKNWKISKTMLPCFGDSVAGHPSRMLQSRARRLVLATCSQVKGPIARGTQRFSRLSSRLPREWDFQSRKTLSKFFQIFRLELFWQVTLATYWRLVSVAKNKCFAFQRQFFPWIFVTVHCLPHFSLNRNWPKHSSNSISASFLLKSSRKRYGFSLSHFIFYVFSVLFLILWVCCCHYAF